MLMRRLVPHFRRALEVQRGKEWLVARLEAATKAIDSLDAGVMAVDGRGRVVMMNEAAEVILESNRGLMLRGGKLVARDASENSNLDRMLISAGINGGEKSGAITIHGDESLRPLCVIVKPLPPKHSFAGERRSALVFVYDPAAKPGSRAVALRNLFGLTPAESRLADLLNEEMNLNEAAARMRVTPGTARFMLKNVFAKTSTRRQSQLLQMLSRFPRE
jgi:DNA-binding CsgD family transcriptional regulator